jgi:hypothetical protein
MITTPAKFMYYDEGKDRYIFWCLNHNKQFHGDGYILPEDFDADNKK